MKLKFLIVSSILFQLVYAQNKGAHDTIMPIEPYNFILGTNTIGGNYQFTNDSRVIEQAKQLKVMGSNILKISLGKNSPNIYGLKIDQKLTSTLGLFTSVPDYKAVFDMDFKYIFAWVHTLTDIEWKKGISKTEEELLYREMFDFASHLLKEYNNTGKTFLIGNWEGDWLLHPNYNRNADLPEEHISNMTKWFDIRQRAIDDAKIKTTAKNVFLYHYIEVNLVLKGMQGKSCIANNILPNVNVDLVSYSSYEAIKNRTYAEKRNTLDSVFNYLEKQLKPKKSIPFTRRVFIGEYGYHANINKPESFKKQYDETKEIMKISMELNLPFALHWQMYNNENDPNGASKQMSLINERGEKMPLYFLHQDFYKQMNRFLTTYKAINNVYPSAAEFRSKAIQVLDNFPTFQ